jgi:hypothetical protein
MKIPFEVWQEKQVEGNFQNLSSVIEGGRFCADCKLVSK